MAHVNIYAESDLIFLAYFHWVYMNIDGLLLIHSKQKELFKRLLIYLHSGK